MTSWTPIPGYTTHLQDHRGHTWVWFPEIPQSSGPHMEYAGRNGNHHSRFRTIEVSIFQDQIIGLILLPHNVVHKLRLNVRNQRRFMELLVHFGYRTYHDLVELAPIDKGE